MTPVEQRGVPALEIAHAGRQITVRRAEVEMKMVVEQGKGEDPPTATGRVAVEQSQPRFAVVVVERNVPAVHAPIRHVEQAVLDGKVFGGHEFSVADPGLRRTEFKIGGVSGMPMGKSFARQF